MKKRILILGMLVCLLFAACGNNNGENGPSNTPETGNNNQTESKFTFVYNNIKIIPNQLVDSIITALGSDYEYFESPSCAYVGLDKCYVYKSFSIYTYPDDKSADHVSQIVITDDAVATAEGVRIGDAADKIAEVYGKGYTEVNGSYSYTQANTTLVFIVKDGKIVSIQYGIVEG